MSYNQSRRIHTEKSSDRRLAAGYKPDSFLKDTQTPNDTKLLEKAKSIIDTGDKASDEKAVERMDQKTGKKWYDSTLVDWDPSHFRLFVGNLGTDVTETLLLQTFIKYSSLSKVRIPKQTRNNKVENKGYAFISFASGEDYLKCFREMNGKYVGNKPIVLQKAKTEIGKTVTKGESKTHKRKPKGSHRKGKKPIV